MSDPVSMMCMTTKKKFDVENPEVVVLKNGRYAYKAECPWKGKHENTLHAFKFCRVAAYNAYQESLSSSKDPEPEE